jgi:hypothetical protein
MNPCNASVYCRFCRCQLNLFALNISYWNDDKNARFRLIPCMTREKIDGNLLIQCNDEKKKKTLHLIFFGGLTIDFDSVLLSCEESFEAISDRTISSSNLLLSTKRKQIRTRPRKGYGNSECVAL